MLKLKLKPTLDLELQEIQYYNLFVSQDLSYISGRTSLENNVLQGENIRVINNSNKFVNICSVDAENVKVQGKVIIKKKLPVRKVTKHLNLPIIDDSVGEYYISATTVYYVENNGEISYYSKNHHGFIIDNIFYPYTITSHEASCDCNNLTIGIDIEPFYINEENEQVFVSYITIETFYYIENGYVDIDGEKYYVDFSGEEPNIKGLSNYIIEDYEPIKWKRETKFILRKKDDLNVKMDDVMFGGYSNYVTYNGENYTLGDVYEIDGAGNAVYEGYGVKIDGTFYGNDNVINNYVNDELFALHKDVDLTSSYIKINEDEFLDINSYITSYNNGGCFLILIAKSEGLDVTEGHHFIAKTDSSINIKINTEFDENGNEFIMYCGKRYDVISTDYFDYALINNKLYRLEYNDDKTKASSFVNGDIMYFTIKNDVAVQDNNIYYGSDEDVKYGIYEEGYEIEKHRGVIIGEKHYMVIDEPFYNSEGDKEILSYVKIIGDYNYELEIVKKDGSSTFICYPVITYQDMYDDVERDNAQRIIASDIINNLDYFSFYIKNEIFGEKAKYPSNFVYEAATSEFPYVVGNNLNITLFKINSYANIKLPIINNSANNLLRDDIINNLFIKKAEDDKFNKIVDMEKDVYYPVFYNPNETDSSKIYSPVKQLRFNLHFRTRQLDNWKIVEDYVENNVENNNDVSNWCVTDYNYYSNILSNNNIERFKKRNLHRASDLVGFMNFTDSDVFNMAKKISKSFLRISFYSTTNPNTQVLLGTSTVFMDEVYLAKRFYSLKKNADLQFVKTQSYQKLSSNDDSSMYLTDSVTVDSELADDYYFADNTRLGSEIVISDKYLSDASSEGFYFYMFKEFSNNMRPLTIYMRVDFNHAGLGITIPFMLPRKNFNSSHINGMPLYIHNENDLKILKNGFKLKDIYKQLYIPINVIYDDVNNRYVYYLPNDIRENDELGVSNDIMELNLFEIKFKDESVKDESYN